MTNRPLDVSAPNFLLSRHLAAAVLAAALLSGCNSGGAGHEVEDASTHPIKAPCAVFTEGIANLLDAGPYAPGTEQVTNHVSVCWRYGDGTPGSRGAFARFEKMSSSSFLQGACRSPISTVEMVQGIGEAACSFNLGDGSVSLAVLQAGGWVVQVGNSTLEKCKQAVLQLAPSLPD